MLALFAIFAACIAVSGCGFWIRRQSAFAACWALVGVACMALAAATVADSIDSRLEVVGGIVVAAMVFLTLAVLGTVRAGPRLNWGFAERVDFSALTLTMIFTAWGFLIEPGWRAASDIVRLLMVVSATTIALSILALVLAPTIARFGICLAALAASLPMALGLALDPTILPVWAPSVSVGFAALVILGSRWLPKDSGREWNFAHRLRNSLVAYSITAAVVILVVVRPLGEPPPVAASLILMFGVASLFILRFSHAYRRIEAMQISASTRNAILRMPTQAASVKSGNDLTGMLTELAQVAGEIVGATRSELVLFTTPEGYAANRSVSWGLTAVEADLLEKHPRIEPALTGPDNLDPFVLRIGDLALSVAAEHAWSVAGKREALVIPLRAGNRVLGLIEVWNPSAPMHVDAAGLAMATDLGKEAGTMIEHALLMLSSRGEIVEAEMLLAVSEVISRATTLSDCLPAVADNLLKRADADRITISLIDESAGDVYIAADARASTAFGARLQGNHWPTATWASYLELRDRGRSVAYTRTDPAIPDRVLRVMELHGAESYLAIPGYTDSQMTSIVQIMSSSRLLAESNELQSIWHATARQIQLGIESVRALEQSRQRELLETMRRRINESMQSAENLHDVYGTIADLFRGIDRVDGATILSLDDSSGDFVVEAEWTNEPIPCRPVGKRHKSRELVILENIGSESTARMRWLGQPAMAERQRDKLAQNNIGAAIATPLRIEDRLVGALMLFSREARPFNGDIIELSEQLAGTIAIVIESILLRSREAEQREEQVIKLRMLEAATSQQDPIAALTAVADVGLGYGGAESINIAFIEENKSMMVIAADSTIPEWPGVEAPGTLLPIVPESIQERALLSFQPQHYSSASAEIGLPELNDIAEYGAHSWICAPLRIGSRVAGFLQVLSREPDAFDARRITMWDEIAQQVSLVIATLQVSFDYQRLSRQHQILARINAASGSSGSVIDTYQTIAEAGLELDGVESSAVYIWHEEDNMLEVASHRVRSADYQEYSPGWRDVPVAWIAGDAPIRPRPTTHIWSDDPNLAEAGRTFLSESNSGRAARFMLVEEGQVHGVLSLKSRQGGPFPEETIHLGEAIATTSAAIVRNLRSRTSEQRSDQEQSALLRLSRAATTSSSEQDLLDVIATTVRELCGARCAEIYTFAVDTGFTNLAAISNDSSWVNPCSIGDQFRTGTWPIELSLQDSAEPLLIHDLSDPRITDSMRADMDEGGFKSLACIPLSVGTRTRGHVSIYSDQPRQFTSAMVRSTATIVNQAALALEHTQQRLEEARVAAQRALLLRVSQAAGSSLDLETVLSEIARASLGVADSESCAVELLDPETNELVLAGVARMADWVIPESVVGKRRRFGSWGIDQIVATEGSVVIGSLEDARINTEMRNELLHFGTQSMLAHPLVVGGTVVGAYYCFARHANAYVEQDRWLAGEIAAHIVSTIQNARMLEHEHKVAQERERLLRITEAATRSLDLADVLQEIANATLGLAGAESCHVELVDYVADEFVTSAYAAIPQWAEMEGSVLGKRCPIGAWSIDRESISGRDPISIGTLEDPRVDGNMRQDMLLFGTESILLIPIWLEDTCVGILNIYSRRRNAFSDAQQTIAYTLATNAANAIQNAQTHERERERSRHQESLLTLTSAATSSLDVNVAMHAVCEAVCAVADSESAVVGIFHPEMRAFEIVADITTEGWDYEDYPGRMYPISEFRAYDMVQSGRGSFAIDSRTSDPGLRSFLDQHPNGLSSYALVPLWLNEVCIGYLGLFDRRENQFPQAVLDLMDAASSLISLALSNGLQWRDEQRRASDRAAVVAVGRVAVSDGEIGLKLRQIAEICLRLHRVDAANIFEWEPDSEVLESLVNVGNDAWMARGRMCDRFELPVGTELRACVESLEPSRFERDDDRSGQEIRTMLDECGAVSISIFPLRAEERIKGVIVLYSLERFPHDVESLNTGQEIAIQTALTIRASRLMETTSRYVRQQSALLSANQAVMNATQSSIGDVLNQISTETMRLIGAECCEIEGLLADKGATQMLAQVSADGWGNPQARIGYELPITDWPITRLVLDTQETFLLERDSEFLTESERSQLFAMGTQTAMIAPMVIDSNSVGVISFYSRQQQAFSDEDTILAREFGSLAALAMDRAKTHMALAEQASYDGLTGLLNHRALQERLDHHIALSNRSEDPLSLLMIDLNEFKLVNDEYGHLAGDVVLRETAAFLKRSLRTSDLVGRYGGDEFLALLPGTDIVQAIALSERLLDLISEVQVPMADGAIVVPSISIGFASYPSQASDAKSLIEMADRAMYNAKNRTIQTLIVETNLVDEHEDVRLIG